MSRSIYSPLPRLERVNERHKRGNAHGPCCALREPREENSWLCGYFGCILFVSLPAGRATGWALPEPTRARPHGCSQHCPPWMTWTAKETADDCYAASTGLRRRHRPGRYHLGIGASRLG